MKCMVAVVLVAASTYAQRAPCTGTLCDPQGAGIAGAVVTFCQETSQTFGLDVDRVRAVTDASGAFSAELLRGSPYTVWAIGERDERGASWVTPPVMTGAAGKRIELRAARRATSRQVVLAGVAPWLEFAPPALRVFVAGHAVGLDLALAGDGTVAVGPWPDDDAVFGLVDDKLQLLCCSELVGDGSGEGKIEVTFPPPRAIECEVVDDDGAPAAGVELQVNTGLGLWRRARDPLPGVFAPLRRSAGRTDERGRAIVPVAWSPPGQRSIMISAIRRGAATSISGYVEDNRYCDGQEDDDDTPMRFVVRAGGAWELGFQPTEACTGAHALVAASFAFSFKSGGGSGDFPLAAVVAADPVEFQVTPRCRGAMTYLRLPPGDKAPLRVAYAGAVTGGSIVDLSVCETVDVAVRRSDGGPAAFCHVGIVLKGRGFPRRWFDRCVADADGKLRVLKTGGNLALVAVDGPEFGASDLNPTNGNAVDLVLRPLPIARLRVVDEHGAPVQGARVSLSCWPRMAEPAGDDLDSFARQICMRELLLVPRSDAAGQLELPLAAGSIGDVELVRGERRSGALDVTASEAARTVTMK